jgi:hypothetical protein
MAAFYRRAGCGGYRASAQGAIYVGGVRFVRFQVTTTSNGGVLLTVTGAVGDVSRCYGGHDARQLRRVHGSAAADDRNATAAVAAGPRGGDGRVDSAPARVVVRNAETLRISSVPDCGRSRAAARRRKSGSDNQRRGRAEDAARIRDRWNDDGYVARGISSRRRRGRLFELMMSATDATCGSATWRQAVATRRRRGGHR